MPEDRCKEESQTEEQAEFKETSYYSYGPDKIDVHECPVQIGLQNSYLADGLEASYISQDSNNCILLDSVHYTSHDSGRAEQTAGSGIRCSGSTTEAYDQSSALELRGDGSLELRGDCDQVTVLNLAQVRALHELDELHVFGYGSLLWKQGFECSHRLTGHIRGYRRRFWQGNRVQRGTPSSPGRVATLEKSPQACTWGVCAALRGQHQVRSALAHLLEREVKNGSYVIAFSTFYPRNGAAPLQALLFWGSPSSQDYLGWAPLPNLARQIVTSRGTSGPNTEYVLRLAAYVARHIPEDRDSHLFQLAELISNNINYREEVLHQKSVY